ncbi:hypothetical protein SISSUDRAFT_677090 [Sistotremastrum suecicum HHB10207 ss-3]|uniref:Uncharacterized protein n=1 Tax=Sistotremastrum suecicum HHB10207 ss-3 TaxID=1314776 RepID=A0A166DZD8_9AGAM|nr:hypothetical protein SISSUDRAFT_677090 [Sistotremastrum suecicum HHB10207 ss-3]
MGTAHYRALWTNLPIKLVPLKALTCKQYRCSSLRIILRIMKLPATLTIVAALFAVAQASCVFSGTPAQCPIWCAACCKANPNDPECLNGRPSPCTADCERL